MSEEPTVSFGLGGQFRVFPYISEIVIHGDSDHSKVEIVRGMIWGVVLHTKSIDFEVERAWFFRKILHIQVQDKPVTILVSEFQKVRYDHN